jgi:hypothetical protein
MSNENGKDLQMLMLGAANKISVAGSNRYLAKISANKDITMVSTYLGGP